MKTILIPTDFSDNAWNAMKYAAKLFEKETCKYILLNTYYSAPPTVDSISVSFMESFSKGSKEGLEIALNRFKTLQHHVNTWFVVESAYGEVQGVVARLTDQEPIDFVVMGTEGAKGLQQIVIGTNTVSVINKVKTPVICVPEEASFQPIKKIVFATDYKILDNEKTLTPIKQLAVQYNAEIAILNVRNEKEVPVTVDEAEEGFAVHGFLEGIEHDFYSDNNKKIEEGILRFAEKHQADIIALVKREHSFLERLFTKGISDQVAFQANIPLLVLHEFKTGSK
jgi:nucleotide-binding universal stress UspA family protein